MSIHIGAQPGQIAEAVLLPGDPLRAQFVAESYLEDAVCHSRVRGMLGFTGTYQGRRVSVQGTGMGIPSISIYAYELLKDYGARRLIRIGTCGALQEDIRLGDVLLAQAAGTDSAVNRLRFGGADFAPAASFELLHRAWQIARDRRIAVRVGTVLTSDTFYSDDPESWRLWARYGVLAAEMESAALYTVAAGFGAQALAILTVSDSLVTGATATTEERQQGYTAMMELALETAISQPVVEEVLTRDPLHLPSLAEAWFLADRAGKAVERVTSTLRGEAQSYLELACDNARFRLYAEVCELLSFFASRCPKWKADAMACYRLAQYLKKAGRKEARSWFQRAGYWP